MLYDSSPWGQPGLPDEGLAIWSVRIDPVSKQLLEVASYDGSGTDSALFLIPPSGTPGEPIGSNGLWAREDGTATLRVALGWPHGNARQRSVGDHRQDGDDRPHRRRTCPPPA